MKFTLHKGKRPKSCWACLSRWASNDMVVRQMADVGFTEVEVTGDGRKRGQRALAARGRDREHPADQEDRRDGRAGCEPQISV
jgi:uncharacterized protein with PIN domain